MQSDKCKVHGNISATESIEVCDQAQLFGDVRTEKFIVAESASFRGRSEPLDGKATSPSFIPTFRHLSSKLA
jgi:cytoskeletal protein CcmA (bactofilin family)